MGSGQQRLGVLLVEMGFIDDAQLRRALDVQQASGKRLGKVLVETGLITEDRLVHALSRQLGIEACDPIMTPVHEAVLAMIPPQVAFAHRVLPVARQREADGESVYVATADPLDPEASTALKAALPPNTELRFMLAGETEMDLALARHYGAAPAEKEPVPTGTPVIQGTPMKQVPQEVKTTGDIFTALQEAVDRAIPSEGQSKQVETPVPVAPSSSGDMPKMSTEDFPTAPPTSSNEPSIDFSSGDMVMTASGDVVPSSLPNRVADSGSVDIIRGSIDVGDEAPPPPATDLVLGTSDAVAHEESGPYTNGHASEDLLVPEARVVAPESSQAMQVELLTEPPAGAPTLEVIEDAPEIPEPAEAIEEVAEPEPIEPIELEEIKDPELPPPPKKPRASTVASSWGDLVAPSDEPEPAQEEAIEIAEPVEESEPVEALSAVSMDLAMIGEMSTELPLADAGLAAGLDMPSDVPAVAEGDLEEIHEVAELSSDVQGLAMLEPEEALMIPEPVEDEPEPAPATQVPQPAEKRVLEATRTFHRLEAFARGESIDADGMEDVLRAVVRVLLDANVITRQRVEDVLPE